MVKHHHQGSQLNVSCASTREYLRRLGNLCSRAAYNRTNTVNNVLHNSSFFIEDLINSIPSTVTGEKSDRRCENILYAAEIGPKHFDTLKPEPGPTYNSGLAVV